MRLTICAVGRLKAGPERDLSQRYVKRVNAAGRSLALGPLEIVEIGESRARDAARRRREEAQALALAAKDKAFIALDEKAPSLSSDEFAFRIGTWRDRGVPALAFLIGGADGLDTTILKDAVASLSFGRLTWPHQLVRIMLAEQLYRAVTLLAGHPYHRA